MNISVRKKLIPKKYFVFSASIEANLNAGLFEIFANVHNNWS